MTRLFSYRIRFDAGSAPNPFWGLCTLAICKPVIRRSAEIGDWVVGTGSSKSPIGDISNKVVYAMRITGKKTMQEYDAFTQAELPKKIPLMTSRDPRRRSGDSIYDYSISPNVKPYPAQRPGVHDKWCRETDLGGKYVLLSDHFFYFGDQPSALPNELLKIVKKGPGHKVNFAQQDVDAFIHWIYSLGYPPATLIGKPAVTLATEESCLACARHDQQEAEADLAIL